MTTTTLTLMHHDPAFRSLLKSIPVALIVGLLLRASPRFDEALGDRVTVHDLSLVPLLMSLTSVLCIWLFSTNTWTRASRLGVVLPFSPRHLWMTRMASILAASLMPVGVLTAILAPRPGDGLLGLDLSTNALLFGLHLAAILTLLAFLLQSPKPRLARIPFTSGYVVYCIIVVIGVLLVAYLGVPPLWGTAALMVLALALGLRIYFLLPLSFEVQPGPDQLRESDPEARAEPAPARLDSTPDHLSFRSLLHQTVARTLWSSPLAWVLLFCVGLYSFFVTAQYYDGESLLLLLLLIAVLTVPLLGLAIDRIVRLDPLPISRSFVIAHMVIPIVAVIGIGIAGSNLLMLLTPDSLTQIDSRGCCLQVPYEHWQLVVDGQPPQITAAWGESYQPQGWPLFQGSRITLYNPYESNAGSSPRFVSLQYRRAAQAVYGIEVPSALLQSVAESDRGIDQKAELPRITEDDIHSLRADGRLRSLAVGLLLLAGPYTGLLTLFLCQFSSSLYARIYRWTATGLLIGVGLLAIGAVVVDLVGISERWIIPAAFAVVCAHLAEWSALPTTALWLLTLAAWAGTCLLLGRQLQGIEAPLHPHTTRSLAEEY
jgi:hypothetical protein